MSVVRVPYQVAYILPTANSVKVHPGGQLVHNSGLSEDLNFKATIYELLPPALIQKPGYDGNEPAALRRQNTERTMYHQDEFTALAEEYRRVCVGEADMSLEEFVTKHRTRTGERLLVSF